MMWSVVIGHFELARQIWLKVPEPMRAAVMAKRLCDKIRAKVNDEHSAELLAQQALRFEEWASGMLDEIQSPEIAADILACFPIRHRPRAGLGTARHGVSTQPTAAAAAEAAEAVASEHLTRGARSAEVAIWSGSVLDEASQEPSPCRNFVAHQHCSRLIEDYWRGNYRGSKACISPHVWYNAVLLQIVIHWMIFVPYGLFGRFKVSVIAVETPVHATMDEDEEEQAGDLEEELDVDFFGTLKREAVVDQGTLKTLDTWLALFNIPKVKFIMHAVFSFGVLILLAVWLCSDFEDPNIYKFMAVRGPDAQQGQATYDAAQFRTQEALEITFWICYLGRVLEEIRQAIGQKSVTAYTSIFWNKVDILLMLMNSIALILRIYETFYLTPCVEEAIHSESGPRRAELMARGCTYRAYQILTQFQRDFQVIGMLLLQFRYFEILTVIPAFSEVWLIFKSMVQDSAPVITMMALICAMTGESRPPKHVHVMYMCMSCAMCMCICVYSMPCCSFVVTPGATHRCNVPQALQ